MSDNNHAPTPKLKRCNAIHHVGPLKTLRYDEELLDSEAEDEMCKLIDELLEQESQDPSLCWVTGS